MIASPYDPLALAYDRHFGPTVAGALSYFDALGLDDLPAGARVLDLCCGTGRVVAALRARGHDASGIDTSAAMLACAQRNASGASFRLADARAFEVSDACDAVVCTFNALNEMHTREDLDAVLRRVLEALRPGGRFYFEVALEDAFSARWRGSFAFADHESVCAVFPSYDPEARLARTRVTVVWRAAGWIRHDIEILQRGWQKAEILEALAQAGFESAKLADAELTFGRANERGRTFGVAVRGEST